MIHALEGKGRSVRGHFTNLCFPGFGFLNFLSAFAINPLFRNRVPSSAALSSTLFPLPIALAFASLSWQVYEGLLSVYS